MRPAHTCPRTMSACQVNRTYRKPKSVLNSTLHIVSAISKADWGTGETLKLESRWRILFTSKLHLEANIISKCICIDIDIDIGGADKINDLFLDWRNSLRISSWDDIVSRCKLRKISRTKRHGGGGNPRDRIGVCPEALQQRSCPRAPRQQDYPEALLTARTHAQKLKLSKARQWQSSELIRVAVMSLFAN